MGYALDDNNKPLVTPEMTAALEKAKKDIIDGKLTVESEASPKA